MPLPEPPPVHGGDVLRAAAECGRDPATVLDFSANIHPLGAPPAVLDAARAAVADSGRYPSPRAEPLRSLLSERLGAEVVLGNGATELLRAAVAGCRRVWVRAPSYLGYAEAAWPAEVCWGDEAEPGDAIVVGRPNNPDGHLPSVAEVAALRRPGVRVVVDESFLGFTDAPSCVGLDDVVVVTSLTKTFGIPGLRLGWATGIDPRSVPTWTVNGPALAAGLACLQSWDWPRRIPLDAWRTTLAKELGRFGEVAGGANFLLLTLSAPRGPELRLRALRDHGVLVRDASNFAGLDTRHVRVAVRTPAENTRLAEALACTLSS
ncbi:MAG: aminotransferase class I/II-fold pyridoxal phosphate-dependent enzyme [Pseudomonadota bacterium]|nr:aminotransferase class I/II-fold pyridoxal phosphate-dependent enzyme [Pseudomonadota bacterium]